MPRSFTRRLVYGVTRKCVRDWSRRQRSLSRYQTPPTRKTEEEREARKQEQNEGFCCCLVMIVLFWTLVSIGSCLGRR